MMRNSSSALSMMEPKSCSRRSVKASWFTLIMFTCKRSYLTSLQIGNFFLFHVCCWMLFRSFFSLHRIGIERVFFSETMRVVIEKHIIINDHYPHVRHQKALSKSRSSYHAFRSTSLILNVSSFHLPSKRSSPPFFNEFHRTFIIFILLPHQLILIPSHGISWKLWKKVEDFRGLSSVSSQEWHRRNFSLIFWIFF